MDSLQEKIVQAAGITLVIIIIGAVFYKFVEGWDWIDSTYFAVSTLTTVGFGDLHPTHSISRLFMILYMLFGIPVMFYTITLLGVYSVEKRGYIHPLRKIFSKTPFEHMKGGKTKKLAKELEQLTEKMTVKMKKLEQEEEKLEKKASESQIKRNSFNS